MIQKILNVLVPPALALGLPGYLKRYLIPTQDNAQEETGSK